MKQHSIAESQQYQEVGQDPWCLNTGGSRSEADGDSDETLSNQDEAEMKKRQRVWEEEYLNNTNVCKKTFGDFQIRQQICWKMERMFAN